MDYHHPMDPPRERHQNYWRWFNPLPSTSRLGKREFMERPLEDYYFSPNIHRVFPPLLEQFRKSLFTKAIRPKLEMRPRDLRIEAQTVHDLHDEFIDLATKAIDFLQLSPMDHLALPLGHRYIGSPRKLQDGAGKHPTSPSLAYEKKNQIIPTIHSTAISIVKHTSADEIRDISLVPQVTLSKSKISTSRANGLSPAAVPSDAIRSGRILPQIALRQTTTPPVEPQHLNHSSPPSSPLGALVAFTSSPGPRTRFHSQTFGGHRGAKSGITISGHFIPLPFTPLSQPTQHQHGRATPEMTSSNQIPCS